MFSGTELVVVILAVAVLVVMAVGAVVGILTRLRRGIVDGGVRSARALRKFRGAPGPDGTRRR